MLKVLPVAEDDILRAYDYIEVLNPLAADHFVTELWGKFQELEDWPRSAPFIPDRTDGLRRVPFGQCVIFYRVGEDDNITISRVAYSGQNYAHWMFP